jgi:hypothetical protein
LDSKLIDQFVVDPALELVEFLSLSGIGRGAVRCRGGFHGWGSMVVEKTISSPRLHVEGKSRRALDERGFGIRGNHS